MQERLSVAYVSAIAAKAGATFVETGGTEYGVDGYLQRVTVVPGLGVISTGLAINCQIKSTITSERRETIVAYDMDYLAYNRLHYQTRTGPFILLLFCLPRSSDEWLKVDEDKLHLQKCCYWHHIDGEPTTNSSSYTIHIPRSRVLTPDSVSELLDMSDRGDI
jgi:hypothetical protein